MAKTRKNRCWSRKNRRGSRKQRGGAATDGGYGMSQQYFNPSFARPEAGIFDAVPTAAPTSTFVRPITEATVPANYDAIQGVGAVPEFQRAQSGGRRRNRRSLKKKGRGRK